MMLYSEEDRSFTRVDIYFPRKNNVLLSMVLKKNSTYGTLTLRFKNISWIYLKCLVFCDRGLFGWRVTIYMGDRRRIRKRITPLVC